jgi:hypothetical protein
METIPETFPLKDESVADDSTLQPELEAHAQPVSERVVEEPSLAEEERATYEQGSTATLPASSEDQLSPDVQVTVITPAVEAVSDETISELFV